MLSRTSLRHAGSRGPFTTTRLIRSQRSGALALCASNGTGRLARSLHNDGYLLSQLLRPSAARPGMDINSKSSRCSEDPRQIPTYTQRQLQSVLQRNFQTRNSIGLPFKSTHVDIRSIFTKSQDTNADPTGSIDNNSTSTSSYIMNPSTPSNKFMQQPINDIDSSPENESSGFSTPSTTPSSTPSDLICKLAKHKLTASDLQNVHDLLVEIAKDAGKIMIQAEHEVLQAAGQKNNSSDIVTKYDHEIEVMVQERIKAAYPTFDFFGEETHKEGTQLSDGPTVVCDPIDGTLNFKKGVPNCAVSLGFTLDKKPIIGVVFNPFRGDMYTAIKNQGAFLTDASNTRKRLPQHPVAPPMPDLQSCLLCVEWGNERKGPNWETRLHVHNALLTDKAEGGAMCKSIRSNGSAALDFCYVAQGFLDAFWEGGVYVWDVCAGWIILEEAGGIVASANPGDWDPTLEGRVYFAVRQAKREEQEAVVKQLWAIMGDRKFVYKKPGAQNA